MATYTNALGQTVTHSDTTTGKLPATAIAVPNTAAAQPAPVKSAAPVAQAAPTANVTPSPFNPQYSGSSGEAGGFSDTHE